MYKFVRFAQKLADYCPAEERVLLVDRQNVPIGSTTRREMRLNHLLHRSTFTFVQNPEGKLFVQMRTNTKDVNPSHYDPSTGGVVSASDESDELSARRELLEELGISPAEVEFCFNYLYESDDNPVWCAVFKTSWEGELVLQPEEVQWVELMTVDEVFARAESEKFSADSLQVLKMLNEQGKISNFKA